MLLDKVDPRQRAWLEIKPDAIVANAITIKKRLPKDCLLMAVVKADGYGHGAETVAKAALKGGAKYLGVATLQEGIDLRKVGITCPILLLGNLTESRDFDACIKWELMPTINGPKEVELSEALAEKNDKKLSVHLKVDTGMARLGCELHEALSLLTRIEKSDFLCLKGVYSHLALADGDFKGEGKTVTCEQKDKFEQLLKILPVHRKSIIVHLANSAGTLRDFDLHYDMVRVGIALYGYSPIEDLPNECALEPALAVKAKITFIREVPPGTGVSYGHSFVTKHHSRLAVVGIGYADGVGRALSGKISVLINGQLFPQVGAITMDQLVIDITGNTEIQVGNVVTLLGKDNTKSLSPYAWSKLSGSIPWEILCSFKYRLPRVIV
ncbi:MULTISPECIES: alanine racemase [Prochlorococcus]|uniref:alanine racemase n=1 Tax=Prochlorococcus TaxID=1218 RepID=UPI000533A2BF|nr:MULTISPECIES: alanine racemase [Prochlorococcus]KGG13554.1 Alanine racemase [Prochlorococcus sp. MIT 0601]